MDSGNKPLHRHPSLQPLSRHHHHALVMAQKLIKVSDDNVDTVMEDLLKFWKSHGDEHFRQEEGILLPTFAKYADVNRPEVIQMLLEHVQIRSQIFSLTGSREKPATKALSILGEQLQAHVRFEERVLFPLIQEIVPEEELHRLPDFT